MIKSFTFNEHDQGNIQNGVNDQSVSFQFSLLVQKNLRRRLECVRLQLGHETTARGSVEVQSLIVATLEELGEERVVQVFGDDVQFHRVDGAVDDFLVVQENAFLDLQVLDGCHHVDEVDDAEENQVRDGLVLKAFDGIDDVGVVQVQSQQIFRVKAVQLRP